jgi:Copper type II ascorbate-dependent monooxygenase, C-terminal domain
MILRPDSLACLLTPPLALVAVSSCSAPASTGGGWGGGETAAGPGNGGTVMGTSPSSNPTTGNNATGGPSSAGNSGARTGSGSGGGSGGVSGGGSGSSSGAKTGGGTGSSSGSPVGSSGGSSAGGGGPLGRSTGCGQASSCTPSDDLAPPANGVQYVLPPGSVTIQPGAEAYYCYYRQVPQAITVGGFQSWMGKGSSHHFILFEEGSGQADGAIVACAFGMGNWRYATSVAGQTIELKFPEGVGLSVAAGEVFDMNTHFVNPGSTPVDAVLKLNVLYATNVQNYASAMYSFNGGINVPPASASGPGTQTVTGSCNVPQGSNFFTLTTHTHRWAVEADVNLVRGGKTTNIVQSKNWEAPDTALWNGPFLTMGAGDSFTYSCSYSNNDSFAVTAGTTASNSEMCMAIGYFFPPGSAQCL